MNATERSSERQETQNRIAGILLEILSQLKLLVEYMGVLCGGVMSTTAAAAYLNISERSLHDLYAQGKLQRVTMTPRRCGYTRKELQRYISANQRFAHRKPETRRKKAAPPAGQSNGVPVPSIHTRTMQCTSEDSGPCGKTALRPGGKAQSTARRKSKERS